MAYIKRIFFFILTNIAVLVMISIIMMILSFFFPEIRQMNDGYVYLLIYSLIIGFAGSFISLLLSRWSAKRMYNITLITPENALKHEKYAIVYNTVERIAREHNIQMPEVGVYEGAEPNAFATGKSKNSSLVAVSTGLLQLMEVDEIEGVVGHEMAHILNGDMVTLTLIQGVVNTFVIFLSNVVIRAIDAYLSRDGDSGLGWIAYNLVYIVLQMIFGFFASLVVMWFSRKREYRADEGGARFTSKCKMIAGLRKLQKLSGIEAKNEIVKENNKKMAAFMITEPDSMFSTHPSLDNRIHALESNALLA